MSDNIIVDNDITIDVKLDKINVQRPSDELINQVEQNTSDITSLEESVSVIENNITENNIDIDNLQTDTIQNSDNIILITQDLETLKIRVSSLTYRVDNLPDIEPINIAIDDLLSRVTAMENGELDITIIDELVVQVNDLTTRVTALEENSGGLSEISNLTFTDAIGQEISVYDGLEEKTIKLPYIDLSMIDMEDEQQQEMLMMFFMVFADSVNGNDENEGTMESPVKTLDVALIKSFQKPNIPGTGQMGLIVLMDGTYQIGEVSETGYSMLSVSGNTAIMAMGSDVTINGVVSVEKDATLQIDSAIALNLYDYSTISGNLACGNLNIIYNEYRGGNLYINGKLTCESLTVESSSSNDFVNVIGEIEAYEIDCEKQLVIGTNGKVTCSYLNVSALDISGYLKVDNSITLDYESPFVQVISVKGTLEADELLVGNYPIYNTHNILNINNGIVKLRSITIDGTTNFLNVIYATSNGQVYVDTLTVTSKANDCPDSCISANYGSSCSIRTIILNCNNTNEIQSNLSFDNVIQCNTGARVYFDNIATSDVTNVIRLLNADGGLIQYNTTNILGDVTQENITAKGGRIFSGEQFDIGEEVLEEIKVVLENNGINMTDVPIENYPQTVEQAISTGGSLSVNIINPSVNGILLLPINFEWAIGVAEGTEVISYLFFNNELIYSGNETSFSLNPSIYNDNGNECYVFAINTSDNSTGVSNKVTFDILTSFNPEHTDNAPIDTIEAELIFDENLIVTSVTDNAPIDTIEVELEFTSS